MLLADEVERAAEAGGVAGREQVFGCRGVGLARPAHRLGHREIDLDHPVIRRGLAVAAASRGGGGGEERLDLVHGDLRW